MESKQRQKTYEIVIIVLLSMIAILGCLVYYGYDQLQTAKSGYDENRQLMDHKYESLAYDFKVLRQLYDDKENDIRILRKEGLQTYTLKNDSSDVAVFFDSIEGGVFLAADKIAPSTKAIKYNLMNVVNGDTLDAGFFDAGPDFKFIHTMKPQRKIGKLLVYTASRNPNNPHVPQLILTSK